MWCHDKYQKPSPNDWWLHVGLCQWSHRVVQEHLTFALHDSSMCARIYSCQPCWESQALQSAMLNPNRLVVQHEQVWSYSFSLHAMCLFIMDTAELSSVQYKLLVLLHAWHTLQCLHWRYAPSPRQMPHPPSAATSGWTRWKDGQRAERHAPTNNWRTCADTIDRACKSLS